MNTILLSITFCSIALAVVMAAALARQIRRERRRADERVRLLSDLAADPADDESPVPVELFRQVDAASAWPRRAAIAAGCLALFAVAAAGRVSVGGSRRAPATRPAAVEVAPLELLALNHQVGDVLTISGIVQNPREGAPRDGLEAVTLAFGTDGSLLGTGRAPIDYARLGRGEESPFIIHVPRARDAVRYRVSFRDAAGMTVEHADRRPAGAVARRESP